MFVCGRPLRLTGVFIQGKEKAEKNADGKENSGDPIPGQLLAAVQPADDPHQNPSKADAVGRSGQQLHGGACQHGIGCRAKPKMKEQIKECRQNKSDFFPHYFHAMMTARVCIFPATLPSDEILFPLVQLFDQAVYLAPAENDPPAAENLSPLAQEMLAQGVLRFECPAPLRADRGRFLSLVHELRQRPAEYANLSLAGFGSSEARETKNAIVRAVLRQNAEGFHQEEQAEEDALLWQARLVLKLGEMLEMQEQELRERLHRLARREEEMQRQLREQDDADEPYPIVRLQNAERNSANRRRLCLKAWCRLAASQPITANVFVAADRDAFDLLLEEQSIEPRLVLRLPLPALPAAGIAAEQRRNFRLAAAELLRNLPASFDQEIWRALLAHSINRHGRCQLLLHVLPGIAPQELFLSRREHPVQNNRAETIVGIFESGKLT